MTSQNSGFLMEAKDSKIIYVHCWKDTKEPRGVLQIFHGMNEHARRYARFAEYLNKNGFIVYADDHRGHGKTAGSIEKLGDIGEDGFNRIVEDEYELSSMIRQRHPGLPLTIFGHSFGSFVAQEYIIKHGGMADGLILSGSAAMDGLDVKLGKALAALQMRVLGADRKGKLLNILSFSGNNSKITDSTSKAAWLSRDKEEVRKFKEDPLCKGMFTIGSYYHFFDGLSKLYIKERLSEVPKGLPVLICSGDADPVGKYGEGVVKLWEIYKGIGMQHVKLKIYPGARHEIINEINKEEVFEDIKEWLCEILFNNMSEQ